ncbi:TIMELESS-interacting protein [Polymixia lowei]
MLEPEENPLFDIPDYEQIEDENFPPLPPPHSPSRGGGEEEEDPFANGEDEGEISKLAEVPTAKRKGVKRPQPKLDSQRLISERGLPALRTLFDNVRFKGKGHEAEDLRLLMQNMENWAHRLYPKLQFDDFIDKVEKLGSKKEVQTCLKRIRLDMPLTHDDFISKDGEEEAGPGEQVFGDLDPFGSGVFPDNPQGPVHSTPAPAAPSLTEEQRKRIELNKQLALERRLARQQQQHADPSDSQPVSSSLSADEPSTSSSSHFLCRGKDQDEEGQDLDLDQGSSVEQPNKVPQHDSLSPDSPQCEKEETSPRSAPQLSNGCEDSD